MPRGGSSRGDRVCLEEGPLGGIGPRGGSSRGIGSA